MADDANAMGPISYLIVQFPGNKMTGEGFRILIDLVDSGVIRILDLMFVTRDADGSMRALEFATLTSTASSISRSSKEPLPECSTTATSPTQHR